MPDAHMLEDYMSGNTTESIIECLTFLYHEPERRRVTDYRISIVFGRGAREVCVGDDLELANPHTGKVRRKRWWERVEEVFEQHRLPFPLYEPATISSLSATRHGDGFELSVRYFVGGHEQLVSTTFTARRGLNAGGNSIKAIKIHRVKERKLERPENPFMESYPEPVPLPRRSGPSPTAYADLLTQGLRNGLVVTRSRDVYDRVTGAHLGRSFHMRSEEDALDAHRSAYLNLRPMCRCELVADDGERYQFVTGDTDIQYIDSEVYSGGVERSPIP